MIIKNARGFYEIGWNNRDFEYLHRIVDKKYHPEWILMEEDGADLVIREIRYLTSCIPDLKFDIVDIAQDGRKVWLWIKMTGTQENEFFGYPGTGKTFEHDGAAILYFDENNKITDRMAFYNFQEIFAQLGHIPQYWELADYVRSTTKLH